MHFEDPKQRAARKRIAEALALEACGVNVELWKLKVTFYCETNRRRDLDRMVSLVMDAASGIIYQDDSQVCALTASQVRGCKKGSGRTEIEFSPLPPLTTDQT
jgi:Holliday junction resolvase RusA-like endonuclease